MWKESYENLYNAQGNIGVYSIENNVLDDVVDDVNEIGFDDICKAMN